MIFNGLKMKKIAHSLMLLFICGFSLKSLASVNDNALAQNILKYSQAFQTYTCGSDHNSKFDTTGLSYLRQALNTPVFLASACSKDGASCEKGAFSLENELTGLQNCIGLANGPNPSPDLYNICCETAGQVVYYMNKYLKSQGDLK